MVLPIIIMHKKVIIRIFEKKNYAVCATTKSVSAVLYRAMFAPDKLVHKQYLVMLEHECLVWDHMLH